ncbi:MAG TPA: ribosome-associated ATPase/putative transporter RbbA [Hyphomicrobium sp.]|nr:ribosome-associated ATPase/putative transporter RbbA [Hyphomicrobium sp.]
MTDAEIAVRLEDVTHKYGRVLALNNINACFPKTRVIGLIGPDGVGKSSLLALVAGARQIQTGEVNVLGANMRRISDRQTICPYIAYMPQGLGKNLYPDLSVQENMEFFARLFGQDRDERDVRISNLLQSTGLASFAFRPARKLSGGMRQKLGLCCSLIHDPDLLILDEPTTGVDPLSRLQFWDLMDRIRARQTGMTVIVSTAYMDEAENFDWLVAMNAGDILAEGTPKDLKEKTAAETVEKAYIALLPASQKVGHRILKIPPRESVDEPVIIAHDLTCRFGDFTAVDRVSFDITRGEIFGFVGSNGCGKTTTMKMLAGLLPSTEGHALLFGQPISATDTDSRRRVGYMSQTFSLYTELTVRQNLDLHAHLFHLSAELREQRIRYLLWRFGLTSYTDKLADDLPLGIRQRLSLAVAVVHEPEVLILDEPTSGVDPVARDNFWELLVNLSRKNNVTIFVSTHFMNEAARCDRVALMHAGRVLAVDTPAKLVEARGSASLEDAFVNYLKDASASTSRDDSGGEFELPPPRSAREASRLPRAHFSSRRMYAYSIRESLELLRDPIRLAFALFGTAFLMLIMGFGITTDVNSLTFAVLDRDDSFESRAYLSELRGSPYFVEEAQLKSSAEMQDRLQSGKVNATVEIPPGFGRDIRRGRSTDVGVWIDGAMPFRAETIRGYIQGTHQQFLNDPAIRGHSALSNTAPPADIQTRFRYNQAFDSIYAMVPSTLAMQLALIPAILMALAIVREKELGSITNLYVTPVTRLEFLIGKQIPYVAVAMLNFIMLFLMAIFIFKVPLKGSFIALSLGALIYVTATTGYGMLISSFTRTQIAALFGTAILTVLPATMFSGLLTPVSSLTGFGAVLGRLFPMTYFVPISVGAFTKGLSLRDLGWHLTILALFIPALTLMSLLLLRKQER